MIKMNHLMFNILIESQISFDHNVIAKVDEFVNIVFPTIQLIEDNAVLLDSNSTFRNNGLKYDFIYSKYTDLTGYEGTLNMMRLSDYIILEEVSLVSITLKLVERLQSFLLTEFPDKKFSISAKINGDETEIRFHVARENEPGWLLEDLDGYTEALLVNNF